MAARRTRSPSRRPSPVRRVVVVGASLAGVHAVEALREAGFDGEVTLIDGQRELPYDRPPLSKAALRDGPVEG
ncbi:MAG: FAD-dependent oxidoreductase, partial [Solirubrobacteraceae bacterium]